MADQPQISAGAYLRLVALGAVVGIPAALAAALFLALVHDIERWLWHDLPDALGHSGPPWYLVIGLPAIGGVIVALVRLLLPGDGGHRPLEGLAMGATPLAYGPGIALAGLGTLSFGAVLGPEAPLIALGSVVGMSMTLFYRANQREQTVLATAGSFSAISALFGGPLVGGLLMVEGGLAMGTALLPVILPGFVASAVGYLIFIGFGDWGGLEAQGLVVPNLPPYNGTHLADLLVAVAVGILGALAVVAARRLAGPLDVRARRRADLPIVLVGGGLAVGLLAQTADWLGADSQDVLFSGQASVPDLVAAGSTHDSRLEVCTELLGSATEELLVPATVSAEVCYMLETRAGSRSEAALLRPFSVGKLVLVDTTTADCERMAELVEQYAD